MSETKLNGKKVIITGGSGFLGKKVVRALEKESPNAIFVPRSATFDLRKKEDCQKMLEEFKPEIIIHLAANVGGIGYNKENPATLFYDNAIMGINLIHEAWKANVEKILTVGTICAYPKITPIPFEEKNLWDGYPEESNAPYGLAKKMLLVQSQAYRDQYDFNAVYLLMVNLYGPGDNFDLNKSHVIPALIKKFVDAKRINSSEVVIWGTGSPTREFLYVDDAAEGIVRGLKFYNKRDPVNLGSSFEISILELAHLIGDLVGFNGRITFDVTKPDGQPRRKLDISKAEEEFGFTAKTSFEEGLKHTIDWYKSSS